MNCVREKTQRQYQLSVLDDRLSRFLHLVRKYSERTRVGRPQERHRAHALRNVYIDIMRRRVEEAELTVLAGHGRVVRPLLSKYGLGCPVNERHKRLEIIIYNTFHTNTRFLQCSTSRELALLTQISTRRALRASTYQFAGACTRADNRLA